MSDRPENNIASNENGAGWLADNAGPPAPFSVTEPIFWTADGDGAIDYFDEQWSELTGRPLAVETGFGWISHVHPDERARLDRSFRDAAGRAERITLEFRLAGAGGIFRHIRLAAAPRSVNGRRGFTGSMTDVTELRNEEKELLSYKEYLEIDVQKRHLLLKGLESKFQIFIDNMPDIAWMKDTRGEMLLSNAAYRSATTGRDEKGQTFSGHAIFSRDGSCEKIESIEKRVLSELAPVSSFDMHETAEGFKTWLMTFIFPVFDHTGALVGTGGISRDITDIKIAEELLIMNNARLEEAVAERTSMLLEEKEKFLMLYRLVPSGTFTVDRDMIVTDWNERAEAITGYSKKEMIGKPCSAFAIEPCLHKCGLFDNDTPKPIYERECIIRKKNGEMACILKNVNYLTNSKGEIVGGIESFEDITDRKRYESAMIEAKSAADNASRMKSAFLANMSHEIRTPLNAVVGFSEILSALPHDDESREMIRHIKIGGKALLSLINDILDFSKIEAGELRVESVEFDLAKLLGEIAEIMKASIAAKGLTLRIELSCDRERLLRGDPGRLRQVLLNLLSNAVKFTPDGSIMLSCAETLKETNQTKISFSVRDEGIGISSEDIKRLFKPFVQADDTISRRFGGTGLGLAISSQLVKLMDPQAELSVTSEPGRGSEFFFEIRFDTAVRADSKDTAGSETPPERSKAGRYRILIAEDDESNRILTEKILRYEGYEVRTATNGKEALAELGRERFDLVIMDVQMPVMDGLSCAAEIRRSGLDIPVIAFSASAMRGDAEACLAAGMNCCISKPVNINEMRATIARLLASGRPDDAPAPQRPETSRKEKTAQKPDAEAFDAQRLRDNMDGNEELAAGAVSNFISVFGEYFEDVASAIAANDADGLRKAAHRLKGGAMNCCAGRLSKALLELEKAGRSGDFKNATALASLAASEFERFSSETLSQGYR